MDRFFGKDRDREVGEALKLQPTLLCSDKIIATVVGCVAIEKFETNAPLITQGAEDNRIAFILTGKVKILVNGLKVAERYAGQHVGEMSVIDITARRSASVLACEKTTVAWVQEADFTKLAQNHPELWRKLAIELSNRLRQRGAQILSPNEIPHVFIGSSSERIRVAKSLSSHIAKTPSKVFLWKESVFGASASTIESLEETVRKVDFAVLTLTGDDFVKSRKKKSMAPRDNVIFELGLFMGAIGRKRTIMVVENIDSNRVKLPGDLDGITHLPYEKSGGNKNYSINNVSKKIIARIAELGPREGRVAP